MKRLLLPVAALVPLLCGALPLPAQSSAGDAALSPYIEGLDFLEAGRYGDAATAFGRAIAADEENGAYYFARGVARTLNQQFPQALADLQRANRLTDGRNWEIRAWSTLAEKMGGKVDASFAPGIAPMADRDYALALGEMENTYYASRYSGGYWDRQANRRVETITPYTGDFPRVARFFVERHRRLTGEGSRVLLAKVQERIKAGDYHAALDALRSLLAARPDDPALLTAEAQARLALSDVAASRRLFTRLLVVQPRDRDTLLGRATAAALEGDSLRVTRDLQLLRRLHPDAARTAEGRLAQTLASAFGSGSPPALWTALESQARAGTSPEGLRLRALELVRALAPRRQRYDERYQDRRFALEEALQAAPNDPDHMVALARFLFDETSLLFEQVEPRSEPFLYRTQSEATRQEDLKTIAGISERALARNPRHVGALALQAHLKFQANQFADTETLLRQALAIKPDDPQVLDLMSQLMYVAAARRAAAAAELRTIKQWSERRLDTYPPADYLYTRYPTEEELARAAALEREARRLTQLAQEHIAKAADSVAGTPLGFFLRGNLARLQGNLEAARDAMQQAVSLDPAFEKAWFQLAGIQTQLGRGDEATLARARALNLTQTTAAPWLAAVWYKIPRTQFKTARENLLEALKFDPADPRIPAYLAILDAATEKPADALAHFQMAVALADARLAARGWTLPPSSKAAPLAPPDLGLPVALRIRVGAFYLEQNKPRFAGQEFAAALQLLDTFPEAAAKTPLPTALLPNPDLPQGTVPLAETPASLRVRTRAGAQYAQWAQGGRSPEDVAFAGKTYNRLLVTYNLTTDNLATLEGLANLGLAQLYVKSNQLDRASAALQAGAAVPNEFMGEMRQVESAVRGAQRPAREPEDFRALEEQLRQMQRNAGGGTPPEALYRAQMRAALQHQLQQIDTQMRDPALTPADRQLLQHTRDALVSQLQELGN